MKADAETEAEVIAVLNRFAQAYEERKIDDFMALLAPDPDVVLIGSGVDEKRVGRDEIKAQAERDWTQSEASSFEFGWTLVSKAGSIALVAADANIRVKMAEQEAVFPGRLTAALDKRGGKWLFSQLHFSMPASGQAEGESWPTQPT